MLERLGDRVGATPTLELAETETEYALGELKRRLELNGRAKLDRRVELGRRVEFD